MIFGLLRQRARDRDTLLFAAAQRVGPLKRLMPERDHLETFERDGPVLAREAVEQAAPGRTIRQPAGQHVHHHGEPRHQIELLKHHADFPAGLPQTARRVGDLAAPQKDLAAGRLGEPVDAAKHGRLAGAARSENDDEFAMTDIES